ncbi:DUF5129 domain-containing protein [Streptomyces sp. JH14]|uniref:hypothetical protein n=1 Tax=Streptomyces sp. JH14 TaxID=2793630 RepID=UPI0023F77037|nr:hypothetical protein [Streptomyces sp. JH14]MDF6042273.1 DUF5129 domain-containing protein [Streptomyces sp. JH14]
MTTVLFVLASVSAIFQASKGQWWTAAAHFLPSLGVAAMLGGMEWQHTPLFWLAGIMFVVAGFGAEAMAYWRTRTAGRGQVDQ